MRAQRVIAFYPELVDVFGSINSAIYYQQLYYWSDKGSRDDGFIYKSKEDIENETKLTRGQQDRVRKDLVERGWLETKLIKVAGAPVLHYKCMADINILISTKHTNGLVQNTLMDKYKTHLSSIHKITAETTTDINTYDHSQSKTPASLSASKKLNTSSSASDTEFEKFWSMYPKKQGKKPAQTSWRRIKCAEYPKIYSALIRQKNTEQWKKNGGQFIPNASTWLNQERWDDEVNTTIERKEIKL